MHINFHLKLNNCINKKNLLKEIGVRQYSEGRTKCQQSDCKERKVENKQRLDEVNVALAYITHSNYILPSCNGLPSCDS